MKDSNLIAFRITIGVIIAALIVSYVYFFVPDLKSQTDSLRLENQVLENEKKEIENVMIDPSVINSEISTLQDELSETDRHGYLNNTSVENDVVSDALSLGINLTSLEIGQPKYFGKEQKSSDQLLYVDIDLAFTTSYENATRFISLFEMSENGMYRIDNITCVNSTEEAAYDWSINMRLLYYGTFK